MRDNYLIITTDFGSVKLADGLVAEAGKRWPGKSRVRMPNFGEGPAHYYVMQPKWSKRVTAAVSRQIGRAPSELQSLMRISYAVFCLKKKKTRQEAIQYLTK